MIRYAGRDDRPRSSVVLATRTTHWQLELIHKPEYLTGEIFGLTIPKAQ